MAGNVIPIPNVRLPGIGIASTSGTGNRIHGSKNEIWLCPAYGHEGRQLALYVKLGIHQRALMVEVLASQIAQVIGLATPEPFIVTVTPSHVGQAGQKPLIAFGSIDESARSMARPIKSLSYLFRLLSSLKIADLACAFDEWIGNDVRSPNDILVCPESRIYLIDHEAAMPPNTDAGASLTNWLALHLMEGLSETQRIELLTRLRSRLAAFRRVAFDGPPLAAGFLQDGNAVYHSLVQFLVDRLEHLDRLLSQRVLPEQLYLGEDPGAPQDEAGRA